MQKLAAAASSRQIGIAAVPTAFAGAAIVGVATAAALLRVSVAVQPLKLYT